MTGGRLRAGLVAGVTTALIIGNSIHPPADSLTSAGKAREPDRQGAHALRLEQERRRAAADSLGWAIHEDELGSVEDREASAAARALIFGLRRP